MFRSRIEGIDNQFRPAPVASRRHLGRVPHQHFRRVRYRPQGEDRRRRCSTAAATCEKPNSSASTTEVNALELTQAYLNFDLSDETGNGSNSSLTAGRFTKDIGSRRLMARNDYRNTINAFTGASFDWQGANKDQMTLFWTMPHNRLPSDMPGILDNAIVFDRENLDLQFFGSSYTFANVFGGSLEVYGYGLYEQDSGTGLRAVQTRNRRLFTPGFRLWRAPKPGQLDYEVEADLPDGSRPGDDRRHRQARPPGLGLLLPCAGGLHLQYEVAPADRRCNTITPAATAATLIPSPVSTPCSAPGAGNTARPVFTGGAAVQPDLTGGALRGHAEPALGCLRRLPPALPGGSRPTASPRQGYGTVPADPATSPASRSRLACGTGSSRTPCCSIPGSPT